MPDQHHLINLGRLDDGVDRPGHERHRIGNRGFVAPAVSWEVEGQDPNPTFEDRGLAPPDPEITGPPVDQDHRRSAGAEALIMDPNAVEDRESGRRPSQSIGLSRRRAGDDPGTKRHRGEDPWSD